jgi:hypothetical protein
MDLNFDDRNLLAPGVHDATLEVVKQHFAKFQKTDRRMTLFKKLEAYVGELKKTGWKCSLILDGSFVMPAVDAPNDIDVILVMPSDWDVAADLTPFEYNLVSHKRTQKEYRIDAYAVPAGSDAERRFLELFQQVRIEWCRQFDLPEDSQKGMVRLIL